MKINKSAAFFIVIMLFILRISFLFSAATGEIKGTVVDKTTGKELQKAAILILEIDKKAETDKDGYFHFLGIRGRTYKLEVLCVGYYPVIIKAVVVHPEVTTTVNIQLRPFSVDENAIEEIQFDPAQIHDDKVSFWQEITACEIEYLPASYISIPHYQNNPRRNIEQILPNSFSVENQVDQTRIIAKEGSARYAGSLQYISNKLGNTDLNNKLGHYYTTFQNKLNAMQTEKFYHPDQLKYAEFFLSGPEPITHFLFKKPGNLTFTLSGEYFNTDGLFPNQNEKVSTLSGSIVYQPNPNCRLQISGMALWQKYSFYDHRWKNTTYESQIDSTEEWNVYHAYNPDRYIARDYNGDGDTDDVVRGMDLNKNGVIGDAFNMLDHLPKFEDRSDQFSINWLHSLNSKMFYEISLSRNFSKTHANVNENINEDSDGDGHLDLYINGIDLDGDGDNRHEDINRNRVWDWQVYGPDTDLFRDENNNGYIDASEYGPKDNWLRWVELPFGRTKDLNDFYLFGYNENISYYPQRWKSETQNQYCLNANFTYQIFDKLNFGNQLKIGVQGDYREIKNHDVTLKSGGNVYSSNFSVFPHARSFYVQNKINLKNVLRDYIRQITGYIGVRYDHFEPNWSFSSPITPVSDSEIPASPIPGLKASVEKNWSPRIGLSFSITNYDLWYYNYQNFSDYRYTDSANYFSTDPYSVYYFASAYQMLERPFQFYELSAHEWGVEFKPFAFLKAEAAIFYKKYSAYSSRKVFYTVVDWYGVFSDENRKYHGCKFSLKAYPVSNISFQLNYRYAEAKIINEIIQNNYEYAWSGDFIESEPYYLDWDRRHTFSGYIHFFIPEHKGPKLFKARPFSGLKATLSGTCLSGLPYSSPQRSKVPKINTERLPSTSRIDLKIEKSFKSAGLNYSLFLEIHNLFDRKNILSLVNEDWYHNYIRMKEKYENGEISKVDYMSIMDQIDPRDIDNDGIYEEPDGEVDFNKMNPEMGPKLDPTTLGLRRRIHIGVKVGF